MTLQDQGRRRDPCVYRVFDSAGALLYVGFTAQGVRRRLLQHRANEAVWFAMAADVDVTFYSDTTTALAAEADIIAFESPLYNRRLRRLEPLG